MIDTPRQITLLSVWEQISEPERAEKLKMEEQYFQKATNVHPRDVFGCFLYQFWKFRVQSNVQCNQQIKDEVG